MTFFPPTPDFKAAVEEAMDEILPEKILDLVWNNFFYYPEVFTSLDSLSESIIGSSGLRFTATPQPVLEVFTGANSSDSVLSGKHLFQQDFLSFDKLQYFRTQFQIDSVSNVVANITIGPDGYGFRISNNSLIGFVTDNDSNETTVTLQTILVNTTYKIEAKFFPIIDKVIFLVDNVEKGVVKGLPTGQHTNLWSLELTTSENATKNMLVQTFELIQKRF